MKVLDNGFFSSSRSGPCEKERTMNRQNAIFGALAVVVGASAIADFQLYESDGEVFVRVWPIANCDRMRLRKHLAALLRGYIEEKHVTLAA
jgi:hypothetical protein